MLSGIDPRRGCATLLLWLSLSGIALAQNLTLRLGHMAPAMHPMAVYLERWAETLRRQSDGTLDIQIFPGGQLGPMAGYYDQVRQGQMDIGWILHGATSDRFPLTGLAEIPFTAGSAEIATRMLNDPAVRAQLDPEHRGVKVLYLFTTAPTNLHTQGRAVAHPDDARGLRIRFASVTSRRFLEALGATPVGLPPTAMAESLQQAVIDGVTTDYGGAGIAFRLGGLIEYSTEFYAQVATFALIMNPTRYTALAPELRQLIDDSTAEVAAEVGQLWDQVDAPGKQALLAGGMQPVTPNPEAMAAFHTAGTQATEQILIEHEQAGRPARALYELMRQRAEVHAAEAFSFWAR